MTYFPDKDAIIWSIKQYSGSKEYLMRAHFGLPSITGTYAQFLYITFCFNLVLFLFCKIIFKSILKICDFSCQAESDLCLRINSFYIPLLCSTYSILYASLNMIQLSTSIRAILLGLFLSLLHTLSLSLLYSLSLSLSLSLSHFFSFLLSPLLPLSLSPP